MALDVNRMTKDQLRQHILMLAMQLTQLEKENKKLKSDLAFERTMLDNVRAEYKSSQNVIKKLREELSAYDREYFDEDMKAKYIFMEEDTLQELREIWELKDDELIYEEWLYD